MFYHDICQEGLRKTPKNLIRYSWSPVRDLKRDTKQSAAHSAATFGEPCEKIRCSVILHDFKFMTLRTSQFLGRWAVCAGAAYGGSAI
jgi:hypothetical protein